MSSNLPTDRLPPENRPAGSHSAGGRLITRLFLCSTPPAGQTALTAALLGESERARLAGYRDRRYREYLTSRLLLRTALSLTLSGTRQPADWTVEERPEQAPRVQELANTPWHFSLSHSRGVIALLLTNTGPCGVDVEFRRSRRNLLELARQWFHPQEARMLAALPEPERTDRFYRLWTLKEAWIKAHGQTLMSGALARVQFEAIDTANEPDGKMLATHATPETSLSLATVSYQAPTDYFQGLPPDRVAQPLTELFSPMSD